jgi:hypothetical protein
MGRKVYESHVFYTGAVWDAIDNDAGHVLVIVGDNEVGCCCGG